MTFAPEALSVAPCEHLLTAGFWQSLKAPWARRLWSTLRSAHNCACWRGIVPIKKKKKKKKAHNQILRQTLFKTNFHQKPLFINLLSTWCHNLCILFFSSLCQTILREHRQTVKPHCILALHRFHIWCHSYHEPVVHANFSETGSNGADVLFRKPGFEEFYSKACRNTWTNAERCVSCCRQSCEDNVRPE